MSGKIHISGNPENLRTAKKQHKKGILTGCLSTSYTENCMFYNSNETTGKTGSYCDGWKRALQVGNEG